MATVTLTTAHSTVTRTKGSIQEGCGHSHSLYAGILGGYTYQSYLSFSALPADFGQLVSATLQLATDDAVGIAGGVGFDLSGATKTPPTSTPRVAIRRLTAAFVDGSNANGHFDSGDYTAPANTLTGQYFPSLTAALGQDNQVDITAMFDQWLTNKQTTSKGAPGPGAANHGIGIFMYQTALYNWQGASDETDDASLKPTIAIVYTQGLVTPNAPTNLTPITPVTVLTTFQGSFTSSKTGALLKQSEVEVYPSTATSGGTNNQTITGARIWSAPQLASSAEIGAAAFSLIPTGFTPVATQTYKWRARVTDGDGQVSLWTDLVSFSTTNTPPGTPTPSPAAASSYASLAGVKFSGGTFTDADGDTLLAFQVQLSSLSSGADPLWDDPVHQLWNTGKAYSPGGQTSWSIPYGGAGLTAGTYYWRARQWDNREGVSAWSGPTSIIVTADFNVLPGVQTSTQIDPKAPWRVIVQDMYQADGVTKTVGRGPGRVIASFENGKSLGASVMYNSPGELHMTLDVTDPQISVINPRQTHYDLQFYQGDNWKSTFQGLWMDFDATETSVIFYGTDYLGLYRFTPDERFDPANPDRPATAGGSKFVNMQVDAIIVAAVTRAKGLTDSPVGFINVGAAGSTIVAMTEKVTLWDTMKDTLAFVSGLIDSHRQGQGITTRAWVQKQSDGSFLFTVTETATIRPAMELRYGENVQGYRLIPFGTNWASYMLGIGRTREGLNVMYQGQAVPGIDTSVYGRFAQAQTFTDLADANDLTRRLKQAAIHAGKLGKQIALGIRSGAIQPLSGFDITDTFPVHIVHGAVDTTRYGSGYWNVMGCAWEANDDGSTNTILTLLPREDTTAPDATLIPTAPISIQQEWQVGWLPPDPTTASAANFLDNNTGIVYVRGAASTVQAVTIAASTDLVACTAHGYSAGNIVSFQNLVGGLGLVNGTYYYVIASGLTANAFRVSATLGGSTIDVTTDATSGTVSQAATYTASGSAGSTFVPPVPVAPTGGGAGSTPVVTATPVPQGDGTVVSRLTVTFNAPSATQPTARQTRIRVTF